MTNAEQTSPSLPDTDVLIVGGGLNGPALALALAQVGISSVICDREAPARRAADDFDGRAYAIAMDSRRLLGAIGVWPLVAERAQPINDIMVTDGRVAEGASPLFLHFDHREMDGGAFGHLLEDRHLRVALLRRMEEEPLIDHRAPAAVAATRTEPTRAVATLADGTEISARLLVACDGRTSTVAAQAGIRKVGWDCGQTGLVCTVRHERPHNGVAHEYFLPSGPFAILPLTENRSSIVWSERTEIARIVHGLDEVRYTAELRRRFGEFLGKVEIEGPRWAYPLNLRLATEYVRPRLALVGDAAHGVHPIAGQGLNLGLRGVAALAEVLLEAKRLGLDIGALDVLERYQVWHRFDATSLALGMDALNRLFSNDIAPLRLLRDLGLAAVNRVGPLRRFFMCHATGERPNQPLLLRGQALAP